MCVFVRKTVTSSALNENGAFNKYKCQQCRLYLFIFDSSLPKNKFIHTTFINLESYHCKQLTLDQVPGKSTNNIPFPFLPFCLRSISKIISVCVCVCVCVCVSVINGRWGDPTAREYEATNTHTDTHTLQTHITLLKIKVLHDAIEEPFCLNGSIKNL